MTTVPLFKGGSTIQPSVWDRIVRSRKVFLFLDYDGTLVPIRKTPSLAVFPAATRRILRRLTNHPDIVVCVVTGRSQADIKRMVGLRGVMWIANHGFEISRGRSQWIHPAARRALPMLRTMARTLRRRLSGIRGALIENKRYTLTVHYRNVRKQDNPVLREIVRQVCEPYATQCRITHGKKVVEVRPEASWNKGCAVEWMLARLGLDKASTAIYIGDDRTDEDAFAVLRGRGVTVLVGARKRSAATYRLQGPRAVAEFLALIDTAKRKNERG